MADYDSQLPIRSKDDVDERVLVKHQDGDDPSGVGRTQEISEKKAHIRNFNKDSDGNDQEVLVSQEGHNLTNGDYDASLNKRPSSQGLIVSDRSAAPDETTMNSRPTAVVGEDDTVCLDVAIRHSDGDRIDENNPLPVFVADNPATEIQEFDQAADIGKNASSTHTYTTTSEFRKLSANCSSAGHAKFVLQVETGVASGVFNTIDVQFNSTANPNVVLGLKNPAPVISGVIVQVVKTNLDNQPTDLYSTINGLEI